MFEFHKDRKRYFDIQVWNAEKHVIPFIEQTFPIRPAMRVLEIGCGEGGGYSRPSLTKDVQAWG